MSKFKGVLVIFCPNFDKFSFDSEPKWLNICWQQPLVIWIQQYVWLLQSFFKELVKKTKIPFQKSRNTCIITKEILTVSSQLSFSAYFESYSLRKEGQINQQNFDKNWAKIPLNFDTFYPRLLRLSEVKKVSNGWSSINFHYSGSHQA